MSIIYAFIIFIKGTSMTKSGGKYLLFQFQNLSYLYFQLNPKEGVAKKRFNSFKKKSKEVLNIQDSIRKLLTKKLDWEYTLERSDYLYQKFGREEVNKDFGEKLTFFRNQESEIERKIEQLFVEFNREIRK